MISIAYRLNKGPTGGGGGVNALLQDIAQDTDAPVQCFFRETSSGYLERSAEKYGFGYLFYFKCFLFVISTINRVGRDQVIICHDPISAFFASFLNKKSICVYHQQGSMYSEYRSLYGKQNFSLRFVCKSIETILIKKINKFIFPSSGALDAFLQTTDVDDESKKLISEKFSVIYNSINEKIVPTSSSIIENVKSECEGKPVFLSVSSITEAKGVDLLPEALLNLPENFSNFKWILCGSGPRERDVSHQVKKLGLGDSFIHISERLTQEELGALYQLADFYIMHHRHSIFDLATLEAMFFDCVPILSKVGGNIELNKCSNVIWINELKNLKNVDDEKLRHLKKLNGDIYKSHFSNDSLIASYMKLNKL